MSRVSKKFIKLDAVDETKIRLSNNAYQRARNAADSADINIVKVNASDRIEFASVPQATSDPVASNDLIRKSYHDATLQGLKPKAAVRLASTANVVIATALEAGDSIDGVVLVAGDRVLLKDQTAPAENGIYIASASGAASRSTDFDSLSPIDEINGAYTFVQAGSTNAGKAFVESAVVAVLDTDPITFAFFNSAGTLVGFDMITISGFNVSVDVATTSGLESTNPGNTAGQLRVKLEASNPSLMIDGSNQLGAKLDAAGAITSGASGLIVGVDSSTVEISSNALRVKDAGITSAKLAAAVAGDMIAGGAGTALSVDLHTTSGLESSNPGNTAGQLRVKLESSNPTLQIDGSNQLGAKLSDGLTATATGIKVRSYREPEITLSAGDITNQYIELSAGVKLIPESAEFVIDLQHRYGVDFDIDNSGAQSRFRFDSTNLPSSDLATGAPAALVAGDKVYIKGIRI